MRAAVEQGVIELIYDGERRKLWKFKEEATESIETINENSESDGDSEEG